MAGHVLRTLVGMNNQHFRMIRMRRHVRVDMQLTELPAKSDMLVQTEILVAKENHLVFEPRIANSSNIGVTQRLR